MGKVLRLASMGALVAALGLAGLAAIELLLQYSGSSLIGRTYSAGRLFEFAGIAMIFAIGLQMREKS